MARRLDELLRVRTALSNQGERLANLFEPPAAMSPPRAFLASQQVFSVAPLETSTLFLTDNSPPEPP